MKKTRFFRPYINSRVNPALGLSPSRAQTGVYVIRKGEEITYVGYSGSNLYKTFTRHFQSWNDHQHRTTYKNERHSDALSARVVFTSPQRAALLERALVVKYKPRDNANKYDQYQIDYKDRQAIEDYHTTPAQNFNDAPPF